MHRFASLFGRRGVLAAGTVALAVFIVVIIQQTVVVASQPLVGIGYPDWMQDEYLKYQWIALGYSLLGYALPFAVGVFASLWIMAPVAAELRLAHVITRSVLAAGIGASLLLIVRAGVILIELAAEAGSFFGNSFPEISWERSVNGRGLGVALQQAIIAFAELSPVVVLAGILLWIWVQTHPARHAVSGMLDEV